MFYLSSSHICKHLFACFYYLIEKKKIKVNNIYVYDDPFYLIELIKNVVGINNKIQINNDNSFIFDYQTIPKLKINKINNLNDFVNGTKENKRKSIDSMIKFFIKELRGNRFILNYSLTKKIIIVELLIIKSEIKIKSEKKKNYILVNEKYSNHLNEFLIEFLSLINPKKLSLLTDKEIIEFDGNNVNFEIIKNEDDYKIKINNTQISYKSLYGVFNCLKMIEWILLNNYNRDHIEKEDDDDEYLDNLNEDEKIFIKKTRGRKRKMREDSTCLTVNFSIYK